MGGQKSGTPFCLLIVCLFLKTLLVSKKITIYIIYYMCTFCFNKIIINNFSISKQSSSVLISVILSM